MTIVLYRSESKTLTQKEEKMLRTFEKKLVRLKQYRKEKENLWKYNELWETISKMAIPGM